MSGITFYACIDDEGTRVQPMVVLVVDEEGGFDGFGVDGAEDMKQAQWLAIKMRGSWRYDHSTKRWHHFQKPGIWAPDKVNAISQTVARLAAVAVKEAKTDPERKTYLRLFLMAGIEKALAALSTFPDYSTDGTDWDQDPNLLGCSNGIVDLRTGKLRKGQPTDLVTRTTGIAYDTATRCPGVLTFLNEVLSDSEGNPQPELVKYLMTTLGAALFGHTRPQQFYVWPGPGGAGKGTLARLTAHVLGGEAGYSVEPAANLYTEPRFGQARADGARADLMKLKGKRFCYVSDPPTPFDDHMLLNHTGGDTITARDLYMRATEMVSWAPTHTIVFSTNNPPAVKEVGVNMKRRLRVIPFPRSFADHPDTGLLDRLKGESEGFLALLVACAVTYANDPTLLDFDHMPAVVRERSQAYLDANDTLSAFFRDVCVVQQGVKALFDDLYDAYAQWHARGDIEDEQMTKIGFGLYLANTLHLTMKRVGVSKLTTYLGIALRT